LAAGIALVWRHRLEFAHTMQAGLAVAADSGVLMGIALPSSLPCFGRCCGGSALLYSGGMKNPAVDAYIAKSAPFARPILSACAR
jgi:hypothetical protein